jgi:hypothetical protein
MGCPAVLLPTVFLFALWSNKKQKTGKSSRQKLVG